MTDKVFHKALSLLVLERISLVANTASHRPCAGRHRSCWPETHVFLTFHNLSSMSLVPTFIAHELRNEMHIHLKRLYRPVQRCAFSGEGSVIPGPLRKQESHEKRSQAKMLMSYIVLCNPRALWLQEYIRSAIERREQLTGGQLLHTDDELHDIGDRSSYGQFHRRMRRWSYRNA